MARRFMWAVYSGPSAIWPSAVFASKANAQWILHHKYNMPRAIIRMVSVDMPEAFAYTMVHHKYKLIPDEPKPKRLEPGVEVRL